MFIQNIKIKNFKCFKDNSVDFCVPDGTIPGSGLNIFVGENNTGKSSLLEAIYFIRNKGKKEIKRIGSSENDDFYVEQTFVGDLEQVIDNFIQDNKKEIFKQKIYQEDSQNLFTVRRNFNDEEEVKKILFYNKNINNFKNETGIDSPFQAFFQISNIWAKTSPDKESKFGSSTVCGNLLSDISEKFKIDHVEQYRKFLEVFTDTFNDDSSGLQFDLNQVAKETEQILNEQFGEAELRFRFDNPEPDILFNNVKIFVKDRGPETELSEKGHGMQRAVILSLLQVYAKRITQIRDGNGDLKLKPHFLFIDEPEMGLHPQAQKKLFEALKVIAQTHQVFISTHSENFISAEQVRNIYKFSKLDDGVEINSLYNFQEDLKPYRKFFFHHHKLFFTNKAIFVEGADDIERYPHFCENENFAELKKDFYPLAGSGHFKVFRNLCDSLGIKSFFLFDIDTISRDANIFNNAFDSDIYLKIQQLNKFCSKKDPQNLLDENLSADELNKKNEIISLLESKNIFILQNGAIEQYLDVNANPLNEERRVELLNLFAKIKNI